MNKPKNNQIRLSTKGLCSSEFFFLVSMPETEGGSFIFQEKLFGKVSRGVILLAFLKKIV